MKSTETKEKIIKNLDQREENLLMMVSDEEIQQSASPVLSKMYEVEENTPEKSLMQQAQRYHNVAHSLIEQRETAYLENDLENLTVNPSEFAIDSLCKLAEQARQDIKLAMDIKKEKSKMMIGLIKVMRR